MSNYKYTNYRGIEKCIIDGAVGIGVEFAAAVSRCPAGLGVGDTVMVTIHVDVVCALQAGYASIAGSNIENSKPHDRP